VGYRVKTVVETLLAALKKFLSGGNSLITVSVNPGTVPSWTYAGLISVLLVVGVLWVSPELRIGIKESLFGPKPPLGDAPQVKAERPKDKKPVVKDEKPVVQGEKLVVKGESTTEVAAPCPTATSAPSQIDAQKLKSYRAPVVKSVEWKCLTYGLLYDGPVKAMKALRNADVAVTGRADGLLRRLIKSPIPREGAVSAVLIKVVDLKFSQPATLDEVIDRASAFGLKPFPVDAIPAAAIAYSDTRRYFFGAHLRPQAVMYIGKPDAWDADEEKDHLALIAWDGFRESFDRERTFDPKATFLFAR
jgi:hypothetical protein